MKLKDYIKQIEQFYRENNVQIDPAPSININDDVSFIIMVPLNNDNLSEVGFFKPVRCIVQKDLVADFLGKWHIQNIPRGRDIFKCVIQRHLRCYQKDNITSLRQGFQVFQAFLHSVFTTPIHTEDTCFDILQAIDNNHFDTPFFYVVENARDQSVDWCTRQFFNNYWHLRQLT